MTTEFQSPLQLPEWQALSQHYELIATQHMRDWFAADPARFSQFSLSHGELLVDYSRNRINQTTLDLLSKLATNCGLATRINQLFSGQYFNVTERRVVLHTALRDKNKTKLIVDGQNVADLVADCLYKMKSFVSAVHDHRWLGSTGKPITDVINVGIGGSHLGAMLCCHALPDYAVTSLRFHFLASVDKALLADTLQNLNPETTLVIVSSKTFSTLETITNAESLRTWIQNSLGTDAIKQHFIGITADINKARHFGLPDENIFPIWSWVGGRYSIWSAIGLPLMLMIGADQFQQFLDGAYELDQHFKQADFQHNAPVILALLSIWYRNFFHAGAQAIVPYTYRLRHFIAYLQQAEMESNGKHTNLHGNELNYATGPIIFGEEGCSGQHSYHQSLHQGQHLVPVDFILVGQPVINTNLDLPNHHDILLASGLSQAQALMLGKTYEEAQATLADHHLSQEEARRLSQHLINPGNRPSNIILLNRLTPQTLGNLLALYEHKVFAQGVIWNINSFDQWGVELGKQLLPDILKILQGSKSLAQTDSATAGVVRYLQGKL